MNRPSPDDMKEIMMAELREENKKLKEYNGELIENHKKDIAILCEENKKLKEELDKREYYDKVNGLDKFVEMSNEMAELEKEIKKLKEELSKYKKQYEHSMGFMEEDTLQELKDIGEI